jgi:hypothetical protein
MEMERATASSDDGGDDLVLPNGELLTPERAAEKGQQMIEQAERSRRVA